MVAVGLVLPLGIAGEPAASAITRPFSADSPFNQVIRTDPVVDAKSRTLVASMTRDTRLYANLVDFSIPVYTATPSTPRHTVTCRMSGRWGTCPFAGTMMPIPRGARPSAGSDGAMVVIDHETGTVGEYWQATDTGSGWVASWGAVNLLSGSGWGGSSTGSGASRLAGVIRVHEIEAGVIDHAIALQSDNICRDLVRPPALKTDGASDRHDCVAEGTRLQLDPELDLDSIDDITPGELIVARALQRYGGYLMDVSGAPLSASFERAVDATESSTGEVFQAAGLSWDYYGMPHVPWSRLRVLRTWQGS